MKNMTVIVCLLALGFAAAASAADEEITKTPPSLEFEAVTATCEEVVAPNVVRVKILGDCALIGVQPMARDDPYYREALEFVRSRVSGKEVRVEVCPNIPVNEKGQDRAVIYYRRDGKWWNLNVELISAGLAKVADVPSCHVPTKSWFTYEKEARDAHRGLWANVPTPKPSSTEGPDISDFE